MRATGLSSIRPVLDRVLPKGALLLSVLTLGSYVAGLVRDRVFARTFGAGAELDAYNAAFVLPELALDVLVASGLAAPFVPIFVQLRRDADAAAESFGQTILTLVVVVMGATALVLFIVAPETARFIAPGFSAEQRELYTSLFRIMCVTPVIFAASIALGEILVAERRFLAVGLAPLAYNAGIILGTVVLSGRIGIYGAAIGAVIGALLHLGVRLWGIRGTTFRVRARLEVRTRAIREFVLLMLPKMLSHPIEPLTFLYFTALASTMAVGSVSSVSFARNFQSVPVSLIGVSIAVAAFPVLANAYVLNDRRGFARILGTNTATIGILSAGAAVGLMLVGNVAIELLLGGGAFDAEDVARTSLVLAVFAISVPFESLAHLFARALYATRNTLLPVLASIVGFVVIVLVGQTTAPTVGIVAIPLSFAAGSVTKCALLGLAIVPRIRRRGWTGGRDDLLAGPRGGGALPADDPPTSGA